MPYVLEASMKVNLVGIETGSTVRIINVSPEMDRCTVQSKNRIRRSLEVSKLEGFRLSRRSRIPNGMWFEFKTEVEDWIRKFGGFPSMKERKEEKKEEKKFELSSDSRNKSGILICLDEYTDQEASELMKLINDWQTTPSAKKLVLNGNFQFTISDKIDNVKFERRKFNIAHQDRLHLVAESILKDD